MYADELLLTVAPVPRRGAAFVDLVAAVGADQEGASINVEQPQPPASPLKVRVL